LTARFVRFGRVLPPSKKITNAKDYLAPSVATLTDLLATPRLGQWENGFDDSS